MRVYYAGTEKTAHSIMALNVTSGGTLFTCQSQNNFHNALLSPSMKIYKALIMLRNI